MQFSANSVLFLGLLITLASSSLGYISYKKLPIELNEYKRPLLTGFTIMAIAIIVLIIALMSNEMVSKEFMYILAGIFSFITGVIFITIAIKMKNKNLLVYLSAISSFSFILLLIITKMRKSKSPKGFIKSLMSAL